MIQDNREESEIIYSGHELSLDELKVILNTDFENGLSSKEAEKRLSQVGPNKIITPKPNPWKVYFAPMLDFLITVYLIMTGIMIILAIWVEGIFSKISFWFVMIALNMIIAIFQQYKAQKKVEALQKLSPPMTNVIRNNNTLEISSDSLVPGDIIELSTGDMIPADSRIVLSSNLAVNEASLTGESIPVEKSNLKGEPLEVLEPIANRTNMLYLGTFVQIGKGIAVVIKTGNNTELGSIANTMASMQTMDIPLRRKVNALGRRLSIVMIVFLIIKMLISVNRHGIATNTFAEDLADAIITAMAVMPINIPLLTTIVLVSGVLQMAKSKVVVKELSVVETLGRCSVLCSDKTGTMTTSEMTVKLIYDTEQYYGVHVTNDYRKNNLCILPQDKIDDFLNQTLSSEWEYERLDEIEQGSTLELALTSAVLNNDAQILNPNHSVDEKIKIIGNATDGALMMLAMAQGFNEDEIKGRYIKYRDYPFESRLKRMSRLFNDTKENDFMLLCKGATEFVLPLCNKIGDENNTRSLTEEKKQEILQKVNSFAEEGYRVISLAYRSMNSFNSNEDTKIERELLEQSMTYIGFSIIFDPPRPGVKEAVTQLDQARVFPIMITGDSIVTAATIARQIGILDPDEMVIEGKDAENLPDDEFFKVSVFARVSPKDKEIIVSRYQSRGDVVAMTGDGVNDALAITKADAGISMGITGTEVTKEAADLIITDDSYVSIVKGIYEGRNLFEKIRIMILFYLTVNLGEALLYFTTSFTPGFYLINQWQRIYIFSIVHAFPVLALIFGPPDDDIMKLKPRNNDSLISKELVYLIVIFSTSYFILMSSIYFMTYNDIIGTNLVNSRDTWLQISSRPNNIQNPIHLNQAKARTMLISMMYLTESFMILSIRRLNKNIINATKKDANLFVLFLILLSPILHFIIMYSTYVQNQLYSLGFQFDIIQLSFIDLIIVFIFASLPIIIIELYKNHIRNKNIQF